jgi:exodeoxyribonuclease V alpha subunit
MLTRLPLRQFNQPADIRPVSAAAPRAAQVPQRLPRVTKPRIVQPTPEAALAPAAPATPQQSDLFATQARLAVQAPSLSPEVSVEPALVTAPTQRIAGLAGLRAIAATAAPADDEVFDSGPDLSPPSQATIEAALDDGEQTIESIMVMEVWASEDRSARVLILKQAKTKQEFSCKVRNAAFEFVKHDKLIVKGKWGLYRNKRQFQATSAVPVIPKDAIGIVSWLKSGKVKGVSVGTAMKLSDAFGSDIEAKISDPEAMIAVGIPAKRAHAIAEEWLSSAGQAELFSMLAQHGLGDAIISRIIRRYGAAAGKVIEENPWILSETIDGVGFDTADKVAMHAGRQRNDPMRLCAALREVVDRATQQDGHCGIPPVTARELAQRLLGQPTVPQAELSSALKKVCDGRTHLFDEEAGLVYPVHLHIAERRLAACIAKMKAAAEANQVPHERAVSAIDDACRELEVTLDPTQMKAAVTALTAGVSVITGGPGTGKTTTQRVIVKALKKLGRDVALAAPTGRAAKRLADVSGEAASTLHRLLQPSTETGGFVFNEENPLPEDWAVVDEASMIGVKLADSFFSALAAGACTTIVGDVDQLPSVESGQILRDLIISDFIPVTRLNVVHRQGHDSGIVTAAHRINKGQWPIEPGETLNGFEFDPIEDAGEIIRRVLQLVSEELPNRGYDPLKGVQVLAGMRKGDLGVTALNNAIKQRLNPVRDNHEHSVSFGFRVFSVGDRVMQMKNNYVKGVYNGEVGFIKAVGRKTPDDPKSSFVVVDYSGYEATYHPGDQNELEQAWACTVHKSQGCEFPVVVFVCPSSHRIMLKRNLLYTAVTRAKTECIVVGDTEALETAIASVDTSRRNTWLVRRLAVGTMPELAAPSMRI